MIQNHFRPVGSGATGNVGNARTNFRGMRVRHFIPEIRDKAMYGLD